MARKKVLLVHYGSASGQLTHVVEHLTAPLAENDAVELRHVVLQPVEPCPFPWPILRFFDTFPESIYLEPPAIQPTGLDPDDRFDLVILAYQVWFLAPSGPTVAFLQSPEARSILKGTPVVTAIVCRDMWLLAQEKAKRLLADCGARLVGNIALVDAGGSFGSLVATPLWLLTGRRGPSLGGLIPRAGVAEDEVRASRRFGERMCQVLDNGAPVDENMLRGLEAVKVNTRVLLTERAAQRGFRAWGALLRKLGPQGAWQRQPVVALYIVFLVILLVTVLPVSALLKTILAPVMRKRIAAQVAYFSQPSGGATTEKS